MAPYQPPPATPANAFTDYLTASEALFRDRMEEARQSAPRQVANDTPPLTPVNMDDNAPPRAERIEDIGQPITQEPPTEWRLGAWRPVAPAREQFQYYPRPIPLSDNPSPATDLVNLTREVRILRQAVSRLTRTLLERLPPPAALDPSLEPAEATSPAAE